MVPPIRYSINARVLWIEWAVIVEKILFVFLYSNAKIKPREQYGNKYNKSTIVVIEDITCKKPKIKPEIKIYKYLFLVISLILFLNIISSDIGAYIITWKAIYNGNLSIISRTASSFVAIELVMVLIIRLQVTIISTPTNQYLREVLKFFIIFFLLKNLRKSSFTSFL